MEDYELTLFDRLNMIRDTINKYGEDKFYLSFSGGKDSTALHHLLDMALPENKIPRVFINTGIEFSLIVKFVKSLAERDDRFVILQPTMAIKPMLDKYGYPFKSKEHSLKIGQWQKGNRTKSIRRYVAGETSFDCPKRLMFQAEEGYPLRLSNQCCYRLKKYPVERWERKTKHTCAILGMKMGEGGERSNHNGCVVFDSRGGGIIKFKPLNPVSDEWEDEFIKRNAIKLCDLYYPPFNFKRTGCKGCPYNRDLQRDLEIMARYLPNERAQCEMIWKPVYDEYRRIGYRLKKDEQMKLF